MEVLAARLARALHDLRRAYDAEAAAVAVGDVPLLTWANLLRVVPDGGLPLADLARDARISRRAATAWLALERAGWLTVEAPAPRTKVVRLTERGRLAREQGRDLVERSSSGWATVVGPPAAELRDVLQEFVGTLPLELPHHPMPYGSADPSATGGASVPARDGPPRIPAHGTDWSPVLRMAPDDVRSLPMHALVSQALMAFVIAVEEQLGFPFWLATMLARSLPDDRPVAMAALPPVLGVNGTGKSLLERHAIVRVEGRGRDRTAGLTARGRAISGALADASRRAVEDLRERQGADVVDRLVEALEPVDALVAPATPELVIVRHRPGVTFADVSFDVAG